MRLRKEERDEGDSGCGKRQQIAMRLGQEGLRPLFVYTFSR